MYILINVSKCEKYVLGHAIPNCNNVETLVGDYCYNFFLVYIVIHLKTSHNHAKFTRASRMASFWASHDKELFYSSKATTLATDFTCDWTVKKCSIDWLLAMRSDYLVVVAVILN